MNIKKLNNNIPKDYLFTFLSRFDLTHGVWMLYLASRGLTLFQIGLMETIYHITSFLMEIPTGAIADIYGRKTSRIIGRLSIIIATIIMIYGNQTIHFTLSFIFVALSNNLESGAGEALIYDSLKEIGKHCNYSKIRGKNEMVYQITRTLSLVLGGYIATISYKNVYISAFIIACLSFIQAFTFTEPSIGKVKRSHHFLDTFRKQLKDSFSIVKKDRRIIQMVLLIELFDTFYVTEFFYLQNRLKNLGDSEFIIGVFLSIGAMVTAFIATKTYKIEKKLSFKTLITVIPFLAIITFWIMTIPGVEKYAFIFLSAIEGILFVSIGDYIHKLIPSEQRATILSLQSMVFSLFMIIFFPFIGKIGDLFGLNIAFKVIAIVSTIVLSFMILFVRKGNHSK